MRPSPRHEGAGGTASRCSDAADRRRSSRSQRGPRGGRVDRAQRSGASLNTATRGKPLRLGPRTPEDPRAIGAPAPQRPSRGHRAGEGPPAPATGTIRTGVQRPDPEAERSGAGGRNRQRVRKRDRQRSGPGHIYTYIPLPTHTGASFPPDSVRGEGRECVCGRARARGVSNSGASCNSKTVRLFTE